MTHTAAFTADPQGFATQYSILVVEPPGMTNGLGVVNGQNNNLAPIVAQFTFGGFGASMTERTCNIYTANAPAHAVDCYFLPYQPDAATSMTLGNAANYFFTSSLSGCTVQVIGPDNAPTVTHGNARATFKAHGLPLAQAAINNMLPAPGGAHVGTVVANDYRQMCNALNLANAQNAFPLPEGFRVDTFAPKTESGGRVEGGAFVFGVCDGVGNWRFWYQAVVGITGRMRTGYMWWAEDRPISNEVVLGAPVQIYP